MDKFKDRKKFFDMSKDIFGLESIITAHFQNEGYLKNQDDVENLCDQAENFIKQKELELEYLRKRVKSFNSQLVNDCIQGDVY